MGHGNSDKLYITHAEHAGLHGSHSSSVGYKASVSLLNLLLPSDYSIGSPKARILALELRLTVAHSHSSPSHILSVLETWMGQALCLIW